MKNIVSVALVAGLSIVGFVACTVTQPPASSPDSSEDSESADTAKKDTTSTTKKSASSSSGATSTSSSSSSGSTDADAGTAGSSSGSSGSSGDDAMCNTVNGSCRTSTVCNEYYGGAVDTQKTVCNNLKGTWSDDPCDTSESVGGCKQITKAANYCGGAISWFFAPMTEDNVAGACPSPGEVITPGDEN